MVPECDAALFWRRLARRSHALVFQWASGGSPRVSAGHARRYHQALANYTEKLVKTIYLQNFLPTGKLGLGLCRIIGCLHATLSACH